MKTITIKDADVRRLVDLLAGKWAHRITRLAGADCRIDNPVRKGARLPGEAESMRKAWEIERDFAGRVLEALGVQLPELSPLAPIVVIYTDRGRQSGSTFNAAAASEEAKRLKDAIVDQVRPEPVS